MIWILLISTNVGMTSNQFGSYESCNQAAQAFASQWGKIYYSCTGTPKLVRFESTK